MAGRSHTPEPASSDVSAALSHLMADSPAYLWFLAHGGILLIRAREELVIAICSCGAGFGADPHDYPQWVRVHSGCRA